jgi:hypothetical protein
MRIPVIRGTIDRRILVNFRVEPEVLTRHVPPPFRPQLVDGHGIAGICLIRLKKVRPQFFPLPWGIGSENAAHRIAVEWDVDGKPRQGVYIPRRDTGSRINAFVGGTLFPGEHHFARFEVDERGPNLSVAMKSQDGKSRLKVVGTVTDGLPTGSVFPSLAAASAFFEAGSLGYSPVEASDRYDGLELRCHSWTVQPLAISHVESSYFDNRNRFPEGSVSFDNALLMRDIEHEWHSREDLCCDGKSVAAG